MSRLHEETLQLPRTKRKILVMSNKVQYGTRSLVNKITGKKASSSNLLLDLAAEAIDTGDTEGLPSLLPLGKARRLMQHNSLKPFKRHQRIKKPDGNATSHSELKNLAQDAFPYLAEFYVKRVVANAKPKHVNKKGFRAWLARELDNPGSKLNQYLKTHPVYAPLTELRRSDDWWRAQLKKQRVNILPSRKK